MKNMLELLDKRLPGYKISKGSYPRVGEKIKHSSWFTTEFYLVTDIKDGRLYADSSNGGSSNWDITSFAHGGWTIV